MRRLSMSTQAIFNIRSQRSVRRYAASPQNNAGYLLYLGFYLHDLKGGFDLLGIGVVIMASTSEKFRETLFNFFLSIFKGIWKLVSRS